MRRAVLLAAAAVLLAGPTVIAFFSGGYFDGPRFAATLAAWVLVLVVALIAPGPLPSSGPGRVALAGLALLVVWTGASLAWAPLSEAATDNLVRLLMYLGAFVAAAALLRERTVSAAAEPALGFGAAVVIGYGVAGRLVPGIVDQTVSNTAFGRLEQPLTYWNAEGALAAMGLVLCARLAGTASRPAAMRVVAAAACAPLGLGLYLTYSRGAIAACVVGLLVLLAAAPTRAQLRAIGIASAAGLAAAIAGEAFSGVALLEGDLGQREQDGAIVLAILAVVMLAAGWAQSRLARAGAPEERLAFAGRLPAVAAVAAGLCLAGLVAIGLGEQGSTDEVSERTGLSRLASADSRRYDYWRVGLDAFADNPLGGVGSGGFRVEWVRERPVDEAAREIHSLPLEVATELGLVGLIAFGLFIGGVAVAGARALRGGAALAPGAVAALTVWGIHASIDWDWQMPATTLPAILLAAGLVAASESRAGSGA
jgi:O-antigen ligase/polysaccharide polymerase Wzy-like membrane protein